MDPSVGMILNSSDMNVLWWVELFVLFSNVSPQIVLAGKAFCGVRTISKWAPERDRWIQQWVATGLMSAQVLSQTKGVLLAVDDCAGKSLIVYRPMVPALKGFSNQSYQLGWISYLSIYCFSNS